jgi:hypothetical protein
MDSKLMYDHLALLLAFIRQMKNEIDIAVLGGDYFDYRLQLNSKTAIRSIKWFDEFICTCKESGVKKVRIIKGTKEHDNDQLEVFRTYYESNDGYFKIFNTTTVEETLPGLKCIYCPDENLNLIDYHQQYIKEMLSNPDIGFFHGSFDVVIPGIEFERIQSHNISSMIYEYDKFSKFIKGPLLAGHWHTPTTYKSLYYVGSYDRWKFNEEEPKGFIYGEYDNVSHKYYIHRVNNPLALEYNTIMVSNDTTYTPQHFADLSANIDKLIEEDTTLQLRVVYMMVTDDSESIVNFQNFQKKYISNRQIKIDIKDLIKKALKKEKKERVAFEAFKYQYIFDNSVSIAEKIQKFIMEKRAVELPVSDIQKRIDKYLSSQ